MKKVNHHGPFKKRFPLGSGGQKIMRAVRRLPRLADQRVPSNILERKMDSLYLVSYKGKPYIDEDVHQSAVSATLGRGVPLCEGDSALRRGYAALPEGR